MIKVAVAKGHLFADALALFAKAGWHFDEDAVSGRQLISTAKTGDLQLLQARPWDVSEYVTAGAADLGVVGRDVLVEKDPAVIQLIDLGVGACRLVLAGPLGTEQLRHGMTCATKFPSTTARYFRERGVHVHLIKLYGSVEMAPATGLSDIISDLTATGRSLKENGLVEIDTILSSTAYLIANPAYYRLDYGAVRSVVDRLNQNR